MTRRSIELLLLCFAAPLVVLLFAILAITQGEALGLNTLGVPIGLFVAFIVAHVAVRKFAPAADPALLPIAFALSGIGIAFVTRLAPDLAGKQVIWLFAGVIGLVLVLAFVKHPDKVSSYKYTFGLLGLILLLSPLFPGIGQEMYGSRIWLAIGSFSFQPGELAKIAIVLFLAGYLAQNREMLSIFTWSIGPFRLPDIRTLLPLLITWGIAMIIVIFEKDLGSALVFYLVFLVMLYVASGKKFYVVIGILLAAVAAVFLYFFFAHVQTRVDIWLDPFSDPSGSGYQLVQSLYSMADGGLFGTGIGQGLADQIPIVESDFIFAAIAEEAGLLGASAILLLFLCFAVRGMVVAARAKSDVSSFMAVGLTVSVVVQAFIIVGGVTKLIPLTGLTLPFISQGGSSLLATFIALGFLLRCGDEGTGVGAEMTSAVPALHDNSVLGRVALGKRITHTLMVLALLLAVLVANLTYIMMVQANDYKNMSGNNHTIAKEQKNQRGGILTSDGVILAQSVKGEDGTFSRNYPAGDLASHVVGYSSQQYGTNGIEATYNDVLKGERSFATWSDVLDYYTGVGVVGNDITLTLNSVIQRAAQDVLVGEKGACVVLDPATGAILAMASSPTYDAATAEQLLAAYEANPGADASELFNRATQAQYAPGSTFKIVSLAIALDEGVASEDDIYDSPGVISIGGGNVTNFDKASYGPITLAAATEYSSNTVFGQLGVQIGADKLVRGSEKFGFNLPYEFDINAAMSLMPVPSEMTTWEVAWAAAGEPVGAHDSPSGPQATVLEMAMVAGSLANNGAVQQPYLVQSIHGANGNMSYQAHPAVLLQAMKAETAARVSDVLEGVVLRGTGMAAYIPGARVFGKTGTAEKGTLKDDSWFTGCALVEGRGVAIAIVIEDGDEGIATIKAQNVLNSALETQGLL